MGRTQTPTVSIIYLRASMNYRQTDPSGSTSTNSHVCASGGAAMIYVSRIHIYTPSAKIMATMDQRCKWRWLSAACVIRTKPNVRLYSYTDASEPVRRYV